MPDAWGLQGEGPAAGLIEQLWQLRAITEALIWHGEHNGSRSTIILFYFSSLSSTGSGW